MQRGPVSLDPRKQRLPTGRSRGTEGGCRYGLLGWRLHNTWRAACVFSATSPGRRVQRTALGGDTVLGKNGLGSLLRVTPASDGHPALDLSDVLVTQGPAGEHTLHTRARTVTTGRERQTKSRRQGGILREGRGPRRRSSHALRQRPAQPVRSDHYVHPVCMQRRVLS